MISIATTRFSAQTWEENTRWCRVNNEQRYGVPSLISDSVPLNSKVVVIELNNPINRVEGIGVVINKHSSPVRDMYSDKNWGRYSYRIIHRFDRQYLIEYHPATLQLLDINMFYGKYHLKRGWGITVWKRGDKVINKILKHFAYKTD